MKKLYCGVLMWIIFSADCFAMTFSQPIQIGKIIYTLLGKMNDGTFVKYLSFRDIWNKYMDNNQKKGRPFTENIYCADDTIVIEYSRYKQGSKYKEGEFRFKWDEKAQWFGVEQVVY